MSEIPMVKLKTMPGSKTVYVTIITGMSTISMKGLLSLERGIEFLREITALQGEEVDNWRGVAGKYGLEPPMR